MCLQCEVDAERIIQNVLPGYSLYRSTNDRAEDEWPQGWYGLVSCNDPDLVFNVDFSFPEELDDGPDFVDETLPLGAYQLRDELELSPLIGWRIIEACRKAGWCESEGDPILWMLAHIQHLMTHWVNVP